MDRAQQRLLTAERYSSANPVTSGLEHPEGRIGLIPMGFHRERQPEKTPEQKTVHRDLGLCDETIRCCACEMRRLP